MRKLVLTALAVGSLVLPFANAEANKGNGGIRLRQMPPQAAQVQEAPQAAKQAEPVVPQAAVKKETNFKAPVVTQYTPKAPEEAGLTATAQVRTNRALVSEEASTSVRESKVETFTAQGSPTAYRMRSGDNVQLTVYGHEDLSTKLGTAYTPYIVRPDGYISLPLIGDVYCAGKTVQEVVNEVATRLSEYVIDPKVSINITKLGTVRVTVLGQITRQGNYELDKGHTLVDAIGAAGGFNDKSAKTCVYVVRRGLDHFVTKVNVLETLVKGDQANNPELQEGDIVYLNSNHKLSFASILSMAYNITNSWDNIDSINKRN